MEIMVVLSLVAWMLTLLLTATSYSSVSLQFTASQWDGGLPVLGYVVVRQENWLGAFADDIVVGVEAVSVSTRTTTVQVSVTGLLPATDYRYVYVAAAVVCSVWRDHVV